MVKELKTNGSGKLPPNIQKRKTKHLTASANDAFATIRITARDCGEGACEEALSYLIEILEQPEFPAATPSSSVGRKNLSAHSWTS